MSYDLKDLPAYIDRLWDNLITSQVPTDFGNVTYYGLLRDCLLMVKKLAVTWNEKSSDFDVQIKQALDLIDSAQNLLESINIDIEQIQADVSNTLQEINNELKTGLENILNYLKTYLASDDFNDDLNSKISTQLKPYFDKINNAINIMGDYEISSNDPVQIRFKKANGEYGDTIDLGDGLASKSMVNGGYYEYTGKTFSGSASNYGIEVHKIVGAYIQDGTPTPDNPVESQFNVINNFNTNGENLFDASKLFNTSNTPVSLELRALPDGTSDVWEDGSITRNVAKVTFDGSIDEQWESYNVFGYNGYDINIPNMRTGLRQKFLCNIYKANGLTDDGVWFGVNSNFIYFPKAVADSGAQTLEEWKTYLSQHPIDVYYALATPTTEQLAIPTLTSYYPFTNAWCDSKVQGDITWYILNTKGMIKDYLLKTDADLKYLPLTNPTLPENSELRGTKADNSAVHLISLRQMLNEQEFIMLGTSTMPIGFVVTDDTTRPIVVRTGSISDYVAFKSDIPEVINNLTSSNTDKSLSANQGRVLNTNINNINTTLSNNLKLKVDKYGLSIAEANTGLTLIGKPIYSKTFYKMTGITGVTNFDVNIANVDDIWIDPSNSFVKTNSHSFTIPKTTIQTESGTSFTSIASNTIETYLNKNTSTNYTLVVSCGNNVVGDTINKIVVTIKYTKTTD